MSGRKSCSTLALLPSLNELRQEFDVERVEFSADKGMFCEENLKLLLDRLDKITDADDKVAAKNLIKNSGSKKYLQLDAGKKTAKIRWDKADIDTAYSIPSSTSAQFQTEQGNEGEDYRDNPKAHDNTRFRPAAQFKVVVDRGHF